MHLVGLTGGIGSGKSTVSSMLTDHGCAVIDADAITRELQTPGQPVLTSIVEAFGPDVLLGNGELDRPALAELVFHDADRLARLNGIVHPAVGAEIDRRLTELAEHVSVAVLDVPLLVESGRDDLELLIVVDVDPEVAIRRLIGQRGFAERDARARIANQIPRAERLRHADVVIDNSGSIEELESQVLELIDHLRCLGT